MRDNHEAARAAAELRGQVKYGETPDHRSVVVVLDDRVRAYREIERLQANDDALKSTCAHAAAVLMQLEFGDHERKDEALTHRLIDALTTAAGQARVDALLDD